METMITEYEKKGIESFYRKEGIRIGEAKGLEKGLAEGRAEGLTAGLAKGRADTQLQIAKNLKGSGISPDIIARTTGLTIEQVQAL